MKSAVWIWALAIAVIAPAAHSDHPLRLGTNVWPGYEPLYLASELGYLSDSTVRLVEYHSASEVIRAFRNESLEAAAVTLDETLLLLQHEVPVQIFLVTDISNGGDAIVAKPEIASFEAIEAKRVGVEGSALGAYVLSRAMEMHGLALDTIEIVQIEVHEHESAYVNDEVDAVVTFEPERTKLLAAGAREIFTSREIPGEIVDVLVVHRSFGSAHPGVLEHLARGWFRALEYLERQPRDAAHRMSRRLRISPEAVLASYEGLQLPNRAENLALLGGQSAGLLTVVRRLEAVMIENQLLSAPMALDRLLTPDAVEAAAQ